MAKISVNLLKMFMNMAKIMKRATNVLTSALRLLLTLFVPMRCMQCTNVIEGKGILCGKCWADTCFIYKNSCSYCGLPQRALGSTRLCSACSLLDVRHAITIRSVFVYENWGASVINRIKFYSQTHLIKPMAQLLFVACADIIDHIDVIIPVPMHWTDTIMRSYNQSALLAVHLGHLCGRPILDNILIKRKRTAHQRSLTIGKRLVNLRRTFFVREPSAVSGKNILLVDDVITTGTTIKVTTRALLKAGARQVHAVSLARAILKSGISNNVPKNKATKQKLRPHQQQPCA